MTATQNNGEDIWRRFEQLLGSPRLSNKIAAVLDLKSPKHPYLYRREGWPFYAEIMVELLEALPRQRWPLALRQRIEIASTPGA